LGRAGNPPDSRAADFAIAVTSTLRHKLGYFVQANLLDRLRDFPIIAIRVEKHEDPVTIELLDWFQQNLNTGFLDIFADLLKIMKQP
jgi:hypothetical protein